MSDHDAGGSAFPVYDHHGNGQQFLAGTGMTLRDYFAAKVMQGICANQRWNFSGQIDSATKTAYQVADAMLKERTK